MNKDQIRSAINAWWEEHFVNDYVISPVTWEYKSQADCVEELIIRLSFIQAK